MKVNKAGRPVNASLRQRRREEILDAAVQLFARHGYADTDTQVLADQLKVGKGTLYRYFPSKKELFLAAVDRVMHRLRRAVDDAVTGPEDPLGQIERAVRAYLDFFKDQPAVVELLIQERALFKDRKRPTYFEHREANQARWREFYRTLMASGRVREMPPERITDVFGNLLYGTMFTNYFAGQRQSTERQAADILDIVFLGILSPSERRRHSEPRNGHKE
jgi:AcrR family transcriptional regulator